jgi:hypothetical protein
MTTFFDRNLAGILWVGYTATLAFIVLAVYGA